MIEWYVGYMYCILKGREFESRRTLAMCRCMFNDKEVKDILGRKGARIKVGSARLRPLSTDHGVGILQQVKLFVPVTIYIVPEILPSVTFSNNQPTNQHSPHVLCIIGFLTKYLLI